MSYAIWSWLEKYARWREDYLQKHPWKRLIPEPLKTAVRDRAFITLGEKGKNIGILAVAVVVLLALAGRSE